MKRRVMSHAPEYSPGGAGRFKAWLPDLTMLLFLLTYSSDHHLWVVTVKGLPCCAQRKGGNSHVTDWKVSPPSCLTMSYSPTNVLSWTSEEKTDKITRSLSLFHIPHTTVGYVDQWDTKLCRNQELEADLQMLTGQNLSASGSNGCRGEKGNLLQLPRNGHIFYLTAPLHVPLAYSRNCLFLPYVSSCACPGMGLHKTWYKPSLNDHPVELPM